MGAGSTVPCANCDHEHVEKGFDGRPSNVCFAVHCRCMSYAPKPPVPTLTPSEVALARMLNAWVEWPDSWGDDDSDPLGPALEALTATLNRLQLASEGKPSPTGAALLDKARRAGVL